MVGIGWGALGSVNSGSSLEHVAIGYNAMHTYNNSAAAPPPSVAVGANSLYSATTGTPNEALGYQALYGLTTGTYNVSLGYDAGYYNKTGNYNVAAGDSSMYGGYPATGAGALYTLATGNTAIGVSTLAEIASTTATNGAYNTAIGYEAGLHLTTGTYNTAVGYRANYSAQTAYGNVAVGSNALLKNTYSGNTLSGTGALQNTNAGGPFVNNYSGGGNVGIGDSVMFANVGGVQNVAVGWAALAAATGVMPADTNVGNIAIGYQSMASLTNGAFNTCIGNYTLTVPTNVSYCVVIGLSAMRNGNSTGTPYGHVYSDVAIGDQALAGGDAIGSYDVAIGGNNANAALISTTGDYDIGIGVTAGDATQVLTSGNNDIALGVGTTVGTTQNNNTAVGVSSAATGTLATNANNTAIGYSAIAGGSSASSNLGNNATAIGEGTIASYTNTTALGAGANAGNSGAASNATAVGEATIASGANSTALGASSTASASNATAIGASATASTANTIILGQTGTATSVGIGVLAPVRLLEVAGATNTIRVDGLGAGGTFNTATTASTDQLMYAKTTGDMYSMPNGTIGYVLTIGAGGYPTWAASTASISATLPLSITGTSNVLLSGTYGGVFYGEGVGVGSGYTGAGTSGEALVGQGPGQPPTWSTLTTAGDNWGTQVVYTDSDAFYPTENTISGQGISGGVGNPLKLASQSASTGQVLAWNGTTWKPSSGNASLTTNNIVNGGGSSVVVVGGGFANSVVGGSNVSIDVQGATGEVLYGKGGGTSAVFTTGGSTGNVLELSGGVPTWTALGTSSGWFLTGNSGTIPGTNFLGTTNDESLVFWINGAYAGSLDPLNTNYSAANVYLGAASTSSPVLPGAGNLDAGDNNVGIGLSSMASVGGPSYTGNGSNSTVGYASGNVAVGVYSLSSLVEGGGNTALGAYSQYHGNYGGINIGTTSATLYGYNTSAGAYSLYSNSNGWYNTAIGYKSMYGPGSATATGYFNTALGENSLYNITGGGSNTALGANSLYNTTAGRNTAVGDSALVSNTTGEYNTALGYDADVSTGGLTNATAVGYQAVATASNSITLGNSNVTSLYLPGYIAVGDILYTSTGAGLVTALTPGASGTVLESAGAGAAPTWQNVSGVQNVTGTPPIYATVSSTPVVSIQGNNSGADAGGVLYSTGAGTSAVFTPTGTAGYVLESNGTSAPTWQPTPAASNAWGLAGNAGTTPGTNFLGTTDANRLVFKVNNQFAGSLDINSTSGGNANTYLGSGGTAAYGGATAYNGAGNNDGGTVNVAVGIAALGSATGSSGMVAMGAFAMPAAASGTQAVAVGFYSQRLAAYTTTSQGYNTSVGAFSLFSNTTGSYNTTVGYQSMYGSGSGMVYGAYNTALGYNSLYNVAGGGSNTAIGSWALYNSSGGKNTGVGDSALYSNTTGTYNTALGYQANITGNPTYATAIGALAQATQSNSLILGAISGVNGASSNTNVGIGTQTPDADAALAVKTLHLETQPAATATGVTTVGTNVTSPALTGTDVAGVVSFNVAAGGSTGGQVTINFVNNYTFAPTVIITAANSATGAIMSSYQPYVSSAAGSFTIDFSAAPSASAGLSFNYFIIESQ